MYHLLENNYIELWNDPYGMAYMFNVYILTWKIIKFKKCSSETKLKMQNSTK